MKSLLDALFPCRKTRELLKQAVELAGQWEELHNRAAKTRDDALDLVKTLLDRQQSC